MVYDVHVWVQNGKVKCASQYCNECSKLKDEQCKPAKIVVKAEN